MRSKIQIPLVEVTADGEGVFTQIIILPADLPLGEYNFRARSDHHMVTSPTIKVWGAAVEIMKATVFRINLTYNSVSFQHLPPQSFLKMDPCQLPNQ